MIEPLGLDRGEHRGVNRGDRAGMAARESNEILIRFLRRRHAGAQVRKRMVLKADHASHGRSLIRIWLRSDGEKRIGSARNPSPVHRRAFTATRPNRVPVKRGSPTKVAVSRSRVTADTAGVPS